MKQIFSLFALLFFSVVLMAQNVADSKPGSLRIVQEVKPAILEIVQGSIAFVDSTGNKAIDAFETCKVVFQVSNTGLGHGYGCVATIRGVGATAGLSFQNKALGVIPMNSTQTVEIPILADMRTSDGRVEFTVQVDEPNGFGTDPMNINVATKAFVPPHLQITDYTLTGTSSSILEKKKPFDLQVLLQNTNYGKAEDVKVTISVPDGIYQFGGDVVTDIAKLEGGQTKSLVYSFIANNNYSGTTIPIKIQIQEKHGKYAEDRTIDLAFNQTFSSAKIAVDEVEQVRQEIQIASLTSEVDKNIPQNPTTNTNTFAFIVANENYQNSSFAKVPFAANDGTMFSHYCRQTLGIPAENIYLQTDVTYAGMLSLITQLKTTAAVNPKSNIIFYYAGHGAPSEATQEAFLIPVDAHQITPQVCFNLQNLYDEFKGLKDSRVTVFLDACFSGSNRDNTMLASARGVAIAPKKTKVEGNLVVFSAASGNETAWPYKSQNHGLFTFFLLKKLQETNGEVTYEELHNYLYSEVRRISNNINHKLQTPTIDASANLGDRWEKWTLK